MLNEYIILVFILILVLLVTFICLYKYSTEPVISGGAGFKQGLENVKNILLVDVANMYTGWYMEHHNNKRPDFKNQHRVFKNYIKCMRDHHKRFIEHNNHKTDVVNYIVKNFRHGGKKTTVAEKMSEKTWKLLYDFVKKNKGVHITVAEDYTPILMTEWKKPSYHYLRGRDDYLCFRMYQHYKKKYKNAVIMSDDKYKDYEKFGVVPKFLATYIRADWTDEKNPKLVKNTENISPPPNILGQMRDYKMVKITLDFNFKDPKFLKSSDYKIKKPGEVWG